MALIFLRSEVEAAPEVVRARFSWDDWYAKNKQRLSEKRAKRYAEDAGYREAALKRSRAQRKKKVVTFPADGYTVSFAHMADQLGVTTWVLREWRRKNYFPEPRHRDHRLWFTPDQAMLLRRLKTFFDDHGVRVSESKREALTSVTALVYANW